jgi:hypothetical protein
MGSGTMSSSLRIIVTGVIAQYPLGGMTWHYLQYVLGLACLGHDVYYLEDTGEAPYDPARGGTFKDCASGVGYLAEVMARYGLSDRWAYRFGVRDQWFGMTDGERNAVIRSADLLLNVSGYLIRPAEYRAIPRLAYVDTDPVFNQIKLARGGSQFCDLVDAHDVHFSFGERQSEMVPATGHHWRPTRQPIVLSEWRPATPPRDVFTTILNWSASKNPPVYEGRTYGQKNVEFERFLDLPARVAPAVLEVAINSGKRRQAPLELLRSRGWHVVDAETACLDFASYRAYIESSKAEWSVAKNGYVQGQPGWFSERSACYLAAGRPVVVQDTGLSGVLPVGVGIVPFRTPDEAVAAVRDVEENYSRHAQAARAIAEAYFSANTVLTRLIDEAMGDLQQPRGERPLSAALRPSSLEVRGY